MNQQPHAPARIFWAKMALLLTRGDARAAYQLGLLRNLGRLFPTYEFPMLTGVSVGPINVAHLANAFGAFPRNGRWPSRCCPLG